MNLHVSIDDIKNIYIFLFFCIYFILPTVTLKENQYCLNCQRDRPNGAVPASQHTCQHDGQAASLLIDTMEPTTLWQPHTRK